MKRIFQLLLFILLATNLLAQRVPGKWDLHLSMSSVKDVAEGDNKIYFLSDAGIFSFNKSDNSIEIYNKLNGLNDSDFQGISYNKIMKCLVITYKNSNIDIILSDGKVFPIPDIKRKNISGDKQIYNAVNKDHLCYLACGFGIVVIDLDKLEVKDTYIIGENGNYQPVYDISFDENNIYAGTEKSIKYAPLNSPNLLDYSNWSDVENVVLQEMSYNILDFGWNRLWAVHQIEGWHGANTYSRHTPEIWYPEFPEITIVHDLNIIEDKAIYCSENSIFVFNQYKEKIYEIKGYDNLSFPEVPINPVSAIIDNEGSVWIADLNYGAIRYKGGIFTNLSPDGPKSNMVFSLAYENGVLWSSAGGRNSSWDNIWQSFQINTYSEGNWETIDNKSYNIDKKSADVIQVKSFPGEPDHFFVATYGGGKGIIEFKNGKVVNEYDESNSTLKSSIPSDLNYMRIGGIDFDSQNNLWVSNSQVENNLHVLKTDGTWKSFTLPEVSIKYCTGQVLVDSYDNIWIVIPRNDTYGLYVMSNDGSQKLHLNVRSFFTNGQEDQITIMNDVYCLAEDNEGQIWVGTSNGVCVYEDPSMVFTDSDSDPYYGDQPGVNLNDGIYHPLLSTSTVTAIAVDGGNRKWCGTLSDGLYLMSADGEEEIEHFTIENSNLISNVITSLAYDGKNGILWVGTQQGLVSYQTDSKDAFDKFTDLYAYPNPVREGYEGDIYITGLTNDSNVKITTVSGRLVFETTSFGGQAVWNGKDLAGNKVHTGVYLAFCASADGSKSAVTKILFIR